MFKVLTDLVKKETKRQQETIDLIPSENVADPEMLKILGSPLVNKYSEGYPGRRYYPGNEFCDAIEELAREEGLKAFGLKKGEWFLNVQPYSGSPANMAIYFALTKPGDTVMGLRLADGGHLTHGHPVNFSGTYYKSVQFGVDTKTGLINYDEVGKLVDQHKPVLIVIGTTSYSRTLDFKRMKDIATRVGAKLVADVSHVAGLIAAGVYPSPFPYADVVMATTHKTMRGPRGAVIFSKGDEVAKLIDKAIMPGLQGGPHNNQTAAIAWMFNAMQKPVFKKYGQQIVKNAKVFEQELRRYDFQLVSGGTDSHLLVVDMRNKGFDGMDAQKLLEEAGIIANRNSVPGDEKPFKPSGVRLGTPAITSRGMKEKQIEMIASFMHRLFDLKESPKKIKAEVAKLCKKFPLPY